MPTAPSVGMPSLRRIGLEAAAVARHLGLDVTLIEMADRILARVASKETADIMRAIHKERGVVIREKTGLTRLIGEDDQVRAAELSDGTVIDVDFVIVGIGVTPNDRAKAKDLAVLGLRPAPTRRDDTPLRPFEVLSLGGRTGMEQASDRQAGNRRGRAGGLCACGETSGIEGYAAYHDDRLTSPRVS
ncbi:hypothetical protein GCM10010924_60020 [Rhizobium wenxiniae]|uniref:FAD/NAD(P)-binding domain-containing protein n=1 Tax=Rhizobium wenxiniae TaxID=1737357 RepID=A0A7X0D1X7_9HYPH|nr:hypothetical protein [Rhizobium wenxiniae]GGG22483.1 hypothetical protein GCM10010924_60020 [Rhizobium wenxiniae]